jgi:PAS domain S-box-containing protein
MSDTYPAPDLEHPAATAVTAPVSEPYRIAIDSIPALVWTALPDGRVDFLNQRWLDFAGLTLEQAMGLGWQASVWPDDLARLVTYWRSLLDSGTPGEIEARLRRSDGVARWFLFRAVPLYDDAGMVVKWYGQTVDIEDRKRAEEAAEKQTAHLDELFELAPHAVVLVDAEVRVIRINREFIRMFGYTPDEAVGRRLEDLVAPEDRLSEYRNNARLLSGGQKVEMETIRRRKDGVRLAVSMTASPVLTAGPIEGYIIYRDITSRKRDEALLAGEKRLLEMVARGEPLQRTLEELCLLVEEQSPGAVCSILLVDREGKRLRHGAAPHLPATYAGFLENRPIGPDEGPCAVAAYRRETVIVSDFTTDPVPDHYRPVALAHGFRACWSIPLVTLDQRVLGTFAVYYPAPRSPTSEEMDLIEQFRHLASIAIERTQAGEALRLSESLLAEAQRLTHTGSFSWKPASGELTWSEETYRIYALDPRVPPTMDLVRERIHPADLGLFDLTARRAAEGGADFEMEHRLQLPDGTVKYLQVVAHASGRSDEPREYVGTVMDVTERKHSEDALDRARFELAHVSRVTTVGQMAASVAHEINQPLAGIVINANACLHWLEGEPPNLRGATDAAHRILRDGQRAGDVIARLRSLFRRTASAAETLQMNGVVREVTAISRVEVQNAGVVLRTELAAGLPPVVADRVQLQQLLLNLILNATESMSGVLDRPRELVLRTGRSELGEVVVSVQDSGVGLERGATDRIFDPFYSTKPEGMGMGLAICRSIVESHGGRLWATSNDGHGATFTFTLSTQRPAEPGGSTRPS